MIVRHFISCSTCEAPHTLRIQVGHASYQEHSFQCTGCGEGMVIGMHCDQQNITLRIEEKENCLPGTREGAIVNLSPDFPIAAEELHSDLAFPSISHVQRIIAAQREFGIGPVSAKDYIDGKLGNAYGPNDLWPILEKSWSLHDRGRHDLSNQKLQEYFDKTGSRGDLLGALFDFCVRMLAPGRTSLFQDAADTTKVIYDKYSEEFNRFQRFYRSDLKIDSLDRYRDTFKEYFSCFTDFSQTLVFARHNIELGDNFEASSTAFSKTKLFYGNAFESLTSNVTILACINNVGKGRSFEEFSEMDLKKYLTINKSNRCRPFSDEVAFANIGLCLESTIRNASHHGGMKLVSNGRRIQYRSGGNGAQRTMTYLEYVKACNEIMLSTCALFALELAVTQGG